MGQPSHMVLGIPNVNWPPGAFVLWVVGFLGRPSGGEGGKLLGESGNLGLGGSFSRRGLFSLCLCEKGTPPPGRLCPGVLRSRGADPKPPATWVTHLFASSCPEV